MPRTTAAGHAVGRGSLVAYSLPCIAASSSLTALTAILPSLYAKYAHVSLAAVGTLFGLMRIFDAVTDPLIGYWSDQTRSRFGPRKPWILAGAMLTTLACWFLYQIPPAAGVAYFATWSVVFYLGYTMYQIPHMAWASEITTDYQGRANLFAYRGVADTVGGLVLPVLPLVLFYGGVLPDTNYTPGVFVWLGWLTLAGFPLAAVLAVRYAPVGRSTAVRRSGLRSLYGSIFGNRPLLRFLGAYLLAGAGSGVFAALFFPYFDTYLGIGDRVPHLLLVAMGAQLVSLPFWARVVGRAGKHRTWGVGWILNSLSLVPMVALTPGAGAYWPALVLTALYSFTNGVSSVAPFALLADVVDYEILKRGVDRAGNYYAFLLFIAKATSAVGGVVFVLLGVVFGYEIADGARNTEFANLGMVLAFCILPSALQILAVPLIWNFPIDARRHATIRRRIERREARAARAAPALAELA
jgi:Na+/melibiose symporter-like transporter